mmetsp:Transcript_110765/g.238399  ORF Transcript_110765/g.238399 Transcript_110765/m.238399 type:complete len:328 (-) Transcript_110765:462-1445(-)
MGGRISGCHQIMHMLHVLGALAGFAQLAGADLNSRLCIKNTGGSCSASDCYAWRESTGGVACAAGRCFCDAASCSGVDGGCYNSSYAYEVLQAPSAAGQTWYTFRNSRWPNLVLRTGSSSTTPYVYVGEDAAQDESKFSLAAPPAGQGGVPAFLIYSKRWGDSVLHFETADTQGNVTYSFSCRPIVQLSSSMPMTHLLMSIQIAPELQETGSPLFMLKAFRDSQFVHVDMTGRSTTSLPSWPSDPGAGGYWHIDPPLPADVLTRLAHYSGPRCSESCGQVGIIRPWVFEAPTKVVSAAPRVLGVAHTFVLIIAAAAPFAASTELLRL